MNGVNILIHQKALLRMVPEYENFVFVDTTNETDAYNFLFDNIPQVTMSFQGNDNQWSSTLGFHVATTSANTIEYFLSRVSSEDLKYAPWMIKLMNTMFMKHQKKTPTSFGTTSMNE